MTKVLLIGATGLVGRHLVDRLLADGVEVGALLRRSAGRAASNWHEHVAEPADWPALVPAIGGDVLISALGTTWRAAGSEAAFRAVDFDAVVDVAAAARAAGVSRMILVSSVGADAASRAFYLRVKGEVEEALAALAFDRLDIVRPGLLRGERGTDRRLKERLFITLSPLVDLLLRGALDRYASIEAAQVAEAIAVLAKDEAPGRRIHHNRELRALATVSTST